MRAEQLAALPQAVDAFLGQAPAVVGYEHVEIAGYRALTAPTRGPAPEPVLLCGEDGSVYVAEDETEVEAVLEQRGMRRTGSSLVLRLPAVAAGRAAVRRFELWASARYRAAGAAGAAQERLWK